MTTVNHETLATWLSGWERRLKEPKDLLMGRFFVNIVPAALEELEERYLHGTKKQIDRGKQSWERRLLSLLEDVYTHTPQTVDLYRLHYGQDVDRLGQLLSRRGPYDVELIYPILQQIQEPPAPTSLGTELRKELLRGTDADHDRLRSICVLLAHRGLQSRDAKKLKDLPKKTLARACVSLLLERHLRLLAENAELNTAILDLLHHHLQKLTYPVAPPGDANSRNHDLFGVFGDSPSWWNLSYRLIDDLREAWAGKTREKAANATMDPVRDLRADREAVLELGSEVIRGFARVFLRQASRSAAQEESREPNSKPQDLGSRLNELLVQTGVFHAVPGDVGEINRRSTVNRAAEALVDASVWFLADVGAERFIEYGDNQVLAAEIGDRLTELLAKEGKNAGSSQHAPEDDEIEDMCSACFARRSTHAALGHLLTPLTERLASYLPHLAEDLDLGQLGLDQGTLPFWERWIKRFSQVFERVDYLSWHTLEEEAFERTIDAFIAELDRPQAEWRVVFVIPNIDPEGITWSMGDVMFYDPRVFDFGEGRWLDPEGRRLERTSFARVTVRADTETAAEEAGRRVLTDALNALSFALSSGKGLGGYKPAIEFSTHFSEVGSQTWRAVARRKRREVYTNPLAKANKVPEFGAAYDHLLSLSARQPRMLNEVQVGFLRAMHWYVKARWEPDPGERFLHCWVGLEHLFVEGRQQSKTQFIENVPRLSITWASLKDLWWVMQSLREVVSFIKSDAEMSAEAEACPELEGWKTDNRILLDPEKVKTLAERGTEVGSPLVANLKGHAEDLRRLALDAALIEQDVEELRDAERFKLLLFNNLRNNLVHEALTHDPNMEVFADELEEILNRVLVRMVVDATSDTPEFATVQDLMKGYQRQPWGKARRGRPATADAIARLQEVERKLMRGRRFTDDSTDLMGRSGQQYPEKP
jgi:hypothetical protein